MIKYGTLDMGQRHDNTCSYQFASLPLQTPILLIARIFNPWNQILSNRNHQQIPILPFQPFTPQKMPLPQTSLTVRGGCNHRTIRYETHILSPNQRPLHSYSKNPKSGQDIQLPMIAIDHFDHCNVRQHATGAVLLCCICSSISYITISFMRRSVISQLLFIKGCRR